MDRQLINYLPHAIREFADFQGITTGEQPEFELVWDAQQQVFDNQFIDTAGDYGLGRWEKMLKIFPKGTDTLELRKARIKAIWSQKTPYTLPWLRRWLNDFFGQENHSESVEDYTIHIQLDHTGLLINVSALLPEILEMLANVLPSNMRLVLESTLKFQGKLHTGGSMAAVTRMPIPEAPDTFRFEDTLRFGGAAAARSVLPVPEEPDAFRFEDTLRFGCAMAADSVLPIPEAPDAFRFKDTMRTGGTMTAKSVLPVPEQS